MPPEETNNDWAPFIIAVAPNGARKTKADHQELPIEPDDIARTAAACRDAGASLIHLHVRDSDGRHTLDGDAYRAAISAIRREVGDDLVIQMTTEAVGLYEPEAQMAAVRDVRPESASIAIREFVPDAASESVAGEFFDWLFRERIMPQFILYAADDVERFLDLRRRGVVPGNRDFVLFVLGRYAKEQRSQPADLLPFLAIWPGQGDWAVCAFGTRENACALTAAALGGHSRVGFENNTLMADGTLAADNSALVDQDRQGAALIGRSVADSHYIREYFEVTVG